MKKQLTTLILIALLSVNYSCKQKVEENSKEPISISKEIKNTLSFIKTDGTKLVDTLGNEIQLKGTNIGNWLVPEGYMFKMEQVNSPRKIDELLYELVGPDSLAVFWNGFLKNYITHDDIKYLKRIGVNHIRLPFNYKMFTDDLYMGERNSGFKYFDKIIEWCREEQLYILLDMHAAPGGQTGDNIDDSYGYPYLYKSKSSQDLMTKIWVEIAERYKNEPVIIGYDLVNEPIAHYFEDELDDLNHQLFLLYSRIIKEIRKVDSEHMIFLNGSVWSTNFDVFEDIVDDNIVYEFHKYWFEVQQEEVQLYVDFSAEHQVPIYVGETGENTDEWVEDFRILLEENNINWCYWPYKKMNNTKGIMNFEQPEDYNLIIEYAQSDRSSYAKIRENRPDIVKVQKALNQYLENSLYQNCFPNTGYSKALGFNVN
ncbi:glycoside hydrolase family 5 protein [Formosa sp. PL04]|uniref:glycoside hydrolase family 5 protein n=1 Tax=Formosa sp. PL04 TaxID=3081755 RepID=UPI002981E48A|nr:cellulase family glycosylhydrolase [Formosa sp. PL04]MDW5287552.1 cellulase family glycosylhydrolase [Formosa sp. PL04]